MVGDRLFGGDSGFYYRGTFNHDGTAVTATVEMTRHDPKWPSAFGDHPRTLATKITGQVQGRDVVGRLERVGTGITVPVALLWAAYLPIRPPVVYRLGDRTAPAANMPAMFLIAADGC